MTQRHRSGKNRMFYHVCSYSVSPKSLRTYSAYCTLKKIPEKHPYFKTCKTQPSEQPAVLSPAPPASGQTARPLHKTPITYFFLSFFIYIIYSRKGLGLQSQKAFSPPPPCKRRGRGGVMDKESFVRSMSRASSERTERSDPSQGGDSRSG